MIVQEVSPVTPATEPELEFSSKLAFEMLLGAQIEACSHYGDRVVACEYHPFVAAVHSAYAEHRPLVLSPDMFWLLVAQGFANHVNLNADAMRHHFVQFEGKKKVVILRDQFIKGSPENDWAGAYSEFAGKLVKFIGKENHDRIVCPFSTTGLVERAANDLVLMDAIQSYFDFGMVTRCGIPSVTLEGTAADWSKLHDKTEELGKAYDVKWWTDKLLPIMERIARNAAGADDPDLWQSVYKLNDESGGPYISGWIRLLFPYIVARDYRNCHGPADKPLTELVLNSWLDGEPKRFGGMTTEFSAQPFQGAADVVVPRADFRDGGARRVRLLQPGQRHPCRPPKDRLGGSRRGRGSDFETSLVGGSSKEGAVPDDIARWLNR